MSKIATDIEQSRKLAKILPTETADMCWEHIYDENHMITDYRIELIPYRFYSGSGYPAWSLAALLDILAKETHNIDEDGQVVLSSYKGNWWNVSPINCDSGEIKESNNPLDAVFDMVVLLKGNGKI